MKPSNAAIQPGFSDATYERFGGRRFPVESGSIWQAGRHRFACTDITGDGYLETLGELGVPDTIYTEPPWRDSTMAVWYSAAGAGKPPPIGTVLDRVLAVAQRYTVPTFLQISKVVVGQYLGAVLEREGKLCGQVPMLYGGKNECALQAITWGAEFPPPGRAAWSRETDAPAQCLLHLMELGLLDIHGYVLDPCMGLGVTALAADRVGVGALGTELSPYRMSACLSFLEDAGNVPVREVR
jgi:hypothetical protein